MTFTRWYIPCTEAFGTDGSLEVVVPLPFPFLLAQPIAKYREASLGSHTSDTLAQPPVIHALLIMFSKGSLDLIPSDVDISSPELLELAIPVRLRGPQEGED